MKHGFILNNNHTLAWIWCIGKSMMLNYRLLSCWLAINHNSFQQRIKTSTIGFTSSNVFKGWKENIDRKDSCKEISECIMKTIWPLSNAYTHSKKRHDPHCTYIEYVLFLLSAAYLSSNWPSGSNDWNRLGNVPRLVPWFCDSSAWPGWLRRLLQWATRLPQ